MGRLFAVVAAAVVLAPAATAAAAPARFHHCQDAAPGARCGSVAVPLDRLDSAAGTIRIEFELYRRHQRSRPSLGTLLAIEGGPGFSTTSSRSSYSDLDRPLLGQRDLLLIDLRGTGRSDVINCPAFRKTVADYVRRAGRCAAEVGARVDLYDTHAAVDDVAAVLDALGIARVDLYGDSYGSYAAQAFAVRHGDRLRSLVLDGTYPLPGTDPAFSDLAEATRRGLRLVCARRPSCAARGQDPVALVAGLVEQVRRAPIVGRGVDTEGVLAARPGRRDVADDRAPERLRQLHDLPRPGRGDRRGPPRRQRPSAAPHRRDHAGPGGGIGARLLRGALPGRHLPRLPPALGSRGAPGHPAGAARPGAGGAAGRAPSSPSRRPPGPRCSTRAPPRACAGPARAAPIRRCRPTRPIPDVPTLVLNGDLDNITASSGARVVAARFPRSTFVEVQNMTHISALGDRDSCGAPLVRHFVETLSAGDTSCASRIEEVRVVDRFPLTASEAVAADPGPGDRSTPAARSAATVAAATVADAIQRWALNFSGRDAGLRGGRWSYVGENVVHFHFARARFARDVAVSGTATWHRLTGPVSARLVLSGPRGVRGRLRVRWNMQSQLAVATFAGRLGGREVRAFTLAP